MSTQWVNAHDSTLYFFPSPALPHDANWIILDPGGIVQEQSASSVRSSILITGISGGGHSKDPDRYTLSQNYPNPFNPSTTIQFDLKEESSVRLQVYNILGQKVTELSFGRMRAGSYNRQLDMSRYTSGIYFYRLDAVGIDGQRFLSSKKMLLLK